MNLRFRCCYIPLYVFPHLVTGQTRISAVLSSSSSEPITNPISSAAAATTAQTPLILTNSNGGNIEIKNGTYCRLGTSGQSLFTGLVLSKARFFVNQTVSAFVHTELQERWNASRLQPQFLQSIWQLVCTTSQGQSTQQVRMHRIRPMPMRLGNSWEETCLVQSLVES